MIDYRRGTGATRVYRAVSCYYIVESRTVYPNFWRVINLIHILLILAHWFGCFYFLLSEAEGFQELTRWPTSFLSVTSASDILFLPKGGQRTDETLGLRVSMGGYDRLLFVARMPFAPRSALKKNLIQRSSPTSALRPRPSDLSPPTHVKLSAAYAGRF
ncbi:cGMP-gated cation channel alpha-1 [Eumeta japonica]|uniref:cGMP-gated cation channel alpha-1 n=1 Tax=Eumeta variegata TaxID=151549 RepID=A0A4C1ZK36_EUMVA|nr:cGMP-gated cation channel alpha-1 [Eumeta japonica]